MNYDDGRLNVFAFGGGVQSTAALVLAARGELDIQTFLFCNVGEDSEHPRVIDYFRDVSQPYATEHGIQLEELRRIKRDGEPETLYERLTRRSRTIDIPVRMTPSGAPGHRNCTKDFKILVMAKWLKQQGATPEEPADVSLGITVDEHQRMADSRVDHITNRYPLVRLRLTRADCLQIVADEGLPEPPKSACWFCPFKTNEQWRRMAREEPELFDEAAELEALLNARREDIGRDPAYLSRFLKPLPEVAENPQATLFDDGDACESGYCMT